MYTYLFHGPSGAGKDTQVEMILKDYDVERIATGEMFRSLYEANDPLGIEAHEYWGNGKFVPAQLTYKLLREWVKKYDPNKDWIFVSVVRDVDQIDLFDNLMKDLGRKLDKFVHISVGIDHILERKTLRTICPKCQATYNSKFKPEKVNGVCDYDGTQLIQRKDDTKEATLSLISEYKKSINEIMFEYEKKNVLLDIDGEPSIEEVYKVIKNSLKFTHER